MQRAVFCFFLAPVSLCAAQSREVLVEDSGLSLLQFRAEKRPPALAAHATNTAGEGKLRRGGAYWPTMGYWPKSVPFPSYKVDRPIKIIQWNDFYFLAKEAAARVPNCEYDMLAEEHPQSNGGVIRDPDFDISGADVVLFYLVDLAGGHYPANYILPRNKPEGQLWFAMCAEPMVRPETNIDCRLVNDTKTMSRMDGYSSFSMASDFPAVQDPVEEEMLRQDPPDFASRGSELATMTISDCKSPGRSAWMDEMFEAFEARGKGDAILSYGDCHNNAEEPGKSQETHWINREAARPFKLVGENTMESGYVTEKVWDALAEGSIPVYWGAPEVKDWVPPGSILYAPDYSVQDLVDKMIAFDAADFEAAYAWKKKPVSEWGGWTEAWQNSHYTLLPRFCEAAAKAKVAREGGAASNSTSASGAASGASGKAKRAAASVGSSSKTSASSGAGTGATTADETVASGAAASADSSSKTSASSNDGTAAAATPAPLSSAGASDADGAESPAPKGVHVHGWTEPR